MRRDDFRTRLRKVAVLAARLRGTRETLAASVAMLRTSVDCARTRMPDACEGACVQHTTEVLRRHGFIAQPVGTLFDAIALLGPTPSRSAH